MISLTMEQVWIIRLQVRRDQVAGDRLLQLIRTHFETSVEKKKRKEKEKLHGEDKKWLHRIVAQENRTEPNQTKPMTIRCNLLKQANLPRSGL